MDNKTIYEITDKIISSLKHASKMQLNDLDERDWLDIEEEWFDYLNDLINAPMAERSGTPSQEVKSSS